MRRLLAAFPKILLAAVPLLALVLVLSASAKDNDKARISGLELEIEGKKVFVSFDLKNAVDEKLEQRIASGLATGIVYDFELVRVRKGWFNKNVDTGSLQVIVMYNAVNREYLVNYKHDGDLIESRLVRDLEELYSALTKVTRLEVFSLEGLNGEHLYVRVRAVLGTRSILFFIPSIRSTDWVESERFKVGPNGRGEPDAAEKKKEGER
jgi:hypothetical protein